MLQLSGDQVTITESVSGLAATWIGKPYPHIRDININGSGVCPTPDADTDGKGIVDALEGRPAYGVAGTTLSMTGDTSINAPNDVRVAPSGATFQYSRTITLDAATLASLKAGTALIVVHGIDSTNLSKAVQAAKSTLALPVAAARPESKTVAFSRSVVDSCWHRVRRSAWASGSSRLRAANARSGVSRAVCLP